MAAHAFRARPCAFSAAGQPVERLHLEPAKRVNRFAGSTSLQNETITSVAASFAGSPASICACWRNRIDASDALN
jgi:hypothetical protein